VGFVGLTNAVRVGFGIGSDNADGRRRTLGSGQPGGSTAVPIFQSIIQAVWSQHAPKVSLSPPSPEARRNLVALQVDSDEQGGKGQVEYFRRDRSGGVSDTPIRLVSRAAASTSFEPPA